MRQLILIIGNTVAPIVFVVLGVMGARTIISAREEPPREERQVHAVLVDVAEATMTRRPRRVSGQGTVVPARSVVVQPEVTGRVLELHDDLVVGGLIAEGDRLFRLDNRDYALAVEQARMSVQSAENALAVEQGRQTVARREWELFQEIAPTGDDASLALREPQLRDAELQIALNRSRLRTAELTWSRTSFDAPFNAIVRAENVEVGQLVGPAAQLATLVGTDTFWVEVAVPVSALSALTIPGLNAAGGETGEAIVRQQAGDTEILRSARIVRLLGELAPGARMARVLVAVDDPLLLSEDGQARRLAGELPLLLGAYVEVEFESATTREMVEIPTTALQDGHTVWVMDDEDALDVRDVTIAWRDDETVYLSAGVASGERVVVTPIGTPVGGMPLRLADSEPSPTTEGEATDAEGANDQ